MRGWNKKGAFIESTKILYYLAILLLLTPFTYLFSSSIAQMAINQNPVPEFLESDIAASRIVNSCFANEIEQTNTIQPGILDKNKINEENLKKCFEMGNSYQPVEVELKYDSSKSIILRTLGRSYTSDGSIRRVAIVDESGNINPATLIVKTWT